VGCASNVCVKWNADVFADVLGVIVFVGVNLFGVGVLCAVW
jgi:hypothetical protein